jgi:hypothetical protein
MGQLEDEERIRDCRRLAAGIREEPSRLKQPELTIPPQRNVRCRCRAQADAASNASPSETKCCAPTDR